MAEIKEKTVDDGKEDLFIPRGGQNEDPNVFISVNGVNYLLPKGKTSRVPHFVANEYRRAQAAEARLNETIDELLEASQK